MKIELNTRGLRKALPFLERLSEDIYDGGINMRIGRDGQLRMDAKNPIALMEIASGYGIEILYAGKDRHNDYCYDIIAEAAPEGVPSPVPAAVNTAAPGDESRPDPKKEAADAAKEAEEREQRLIDRINTGFQNVWPDQLEKIGEVLDIALADIEFKKQLKQDVRAPQI